jgi:hypothetical protein
MKTLIALCLFFSFALAESWQTCESIGMLFDYLNPLATLETEYANTGHNGDFEEAIYNAALEYQIAEPPITAVVGYYVVMTFPDLDDQVYVFVVRGISETEFILCGFKATPTMLFSGEQS